MIDILPIKVHSDQKHPENLNEISQAKTKSGKYLNKECYSEHHQELSLKYFVKILLISKLF